MPSYLFRNASVLLSGERQLRRRMSVLVQHGAIAAVTNEAIDDRSAAIIDVRGKTLMPGLIDAHAHVTGLSLSPKNLAQPASEITIVAAHYLRSSLMLGFTTIREAGGADYVLARLLKEAEIVEGPSDRPAPAPCSKPSDAGPNTSGAGSPPRSRSPRRCNTA